MEKATETVNTKFSAALTAQEIKDLDNLNADIESSERTLEVALNFFSNRDAELQKRRKEFWDDLYKKHSLIKEKNYIVDISGTEVMLREKYV